MADRFHRRRRKAPRTVPVLALLALLGPAVRASEDRPTPVPRTVLALVDSGPRQWEIDENDEVQQYYEMPLNHLGLTVRRHDVRNGPPPPEYLEDLRAVLTAFDYTTEPVEWLWPWLEERRRQGVRFVHLGEFGPMVVGPEGNSSTLKAWLGGFGLGYDDAHLEIPLGTTVEFADFGKCSLEEDPRANYIHRGPWNESDENRPWIMTKCPGLDGRVRTPVTTGPWGGVALFPWVYDDRGVLGSRRLLLDLFEFFAEALDMKGLPAPHPSVLNGRRIFFCQVDGDGYESLSTVDYGKMCGEVFYDFVEKHELPITVSIIVASLTDDLLVEQPTPAMRSAARLLMHPRVEPATHTVLHPFSWQKEPGKEFPASAGYPGIANYKPTPAAEVRESVEFINERLLSGGRTCRVVLWSGDACPPDEALAECERLGLPNLNSGIARWDRLNESVSFVSPWGRRRGDLAQAYAGAANENVYEGYFTLHPYSYHHVDVPIERTGGARILKPANIYIHFYSVEHPLRFAALEALMKRWAYEEETAPVFASVYAEAVLDALRTARIFRTPRGFAFRDFGGCRTVRFDGPVDPIDWDASPGILGARRIGDSLYLHLSSPDAEVAFAKEAVTRPLLEQANHVLTDCERGPDRIAVTSESVAPRILVFAGLPPEAEVRLVVDDAAETRTTTADGKLALEFRPGRSRIEVALR